MRGDGLALQVFPNPLDSRLAPDPALLHAAIRREMVYGVHAVRIDPDLPRLQLAGDAKGAIHIAAPDRTAEPINRTVGARDRVVKVVVSRNRYCRAELLFGHQ